MNPSHSTLAPLLELPCLTRRRIAFISENTRDREAWCRWVPGARIRHHLHQAIKYWDMAMEAAKAKEPELYLIFEHQPQYSPLLYTVLLFRRKPVFFVVHYIQQACHRSVLHMLALKMMIVLVRHGRFHPVHLERGDDCLSAGIRFPEGRSLVIPMPHPHASDRDDLNPDRWTRARFRVGVIGALREEKPTKRLIETLMKIRKAGGEEFDLVLGAPLWQRDKWVEELGVETMDTSAEEDYVRALRSLNICVFDFDRSAYYFRPSGVINDAGMCGCYVICPRYPIFEAQISTPVPIGRTYAGQGELREAVRASLAGLRASRPDFARWRSHRRMAAIAERFEGFFESVDGLAPRGRMP